MLENIDLNVYKWANTPGTAERFKIICMECPFSLNRIIRDIHHKGLPQPPQSIARVIAVLHLGGIVVILL